MVLTLLWFQVLRAQLELGQVRQEIDRRLAEKEEEFNNSRSQFLSLQRRHLKVPFDFCPTYHFLKVGSHKFTRPMTYKVFGWGFCCLTFLKMLRSMYAFSDSNF
jgi:hypothetical protein